MQAKSPSSSVLIRPSNLRLKSPLSSAVSSHDLSRTSQSPSLPYYHPPSTAPHPPPPTPTSSSLIRSSSYTHARPPSDGLSVVPVDSRFVAAYSSPRRSGGFPSPSVPVLVQTTLLPPSPRRPPLSHGGVSSAPPDSSLLLSFLHDSSDMSFSEALNLSTATSADAVPPPPFAPRASSAVVLLAVASSHSPVRGPPRTAATAGARLLPTHPPPPPSHDLQSDDDDDDDDDVSLSEFLPRGAGDVSAVERDDDDDDDDEEGESSFDGRYAGGGKAAALRQHQHQPRHQLASRQSPRLPPSTVASLFVRSLSSLLSRHLSRRVSRVFHHWRSFSSSSSLSVVFGGRLLLSVYRYQCRVVVLRRFHSWRRIARLLTVEHRRLDPKSADNVRKLTRAFKAGRTARVRSAFASWRKTASDDDRTSLQTRYSQTKDMYDVLASTHAKTLSKCAAVAALNGDLADKCMSLENGSAVCRAASVEARTSLALTKLNTLMCCKRTLPLIWGPSVPPSVGGVGGEHVVRSAHPLLSSFGGHPLSQPFRKWEVLTRASLWAESASEHGLSADLSWQKDRVSSLQAQLAAAVATADERTWTADVMARQLVKGAEESARRLIEIEDLQDKVLRMESVEAERQAENYKLREMLKAHIEREKDRSEEPKPPMGRRRSSAAASPTNARGGGAAGARGSPRKLTIPNKFSAADLFTQSQGSLLSRLETEAGEVMHGLQNVKLQESDLRGDDDLLITGKRIPDKTREKDQGADQAAAAAAGGHATQQQREREHEQHHQHSSAGPLDAGVMRLAQDEAASSVLAMNRDGLRRCFEHYSRPQRVGSTIAKRKRDGVASSGKENDAGGARVLDEDSFLRLCREMGLCQLLPNNNKLSSAFEATAFEAAEEAKPVQDAKGFVSSIAIIAMLAFAKESHFTPREKVGSLLHLFDSEGLYVTWTPPVIIGKQAEEVLFEIFQNYCSALDRKKEGPAVCLTSGAYAKFVKEFNVLRGVAASSGKTDTVFREVVMKRAHAGEKKGGNSRQSIGGAQNNKHPSSSRMSFDDFILSLASMARLRNRSLENESDSVVVQSMCAELISSAVQQEAGYE